MGSVPESGRPRRVANGTQLQYSCLENPMDRGVWQATVHGAAKNQIWLSSSACACARAHTHTHTHTHHMPYKWLNGCACKENTCYAGRRLEHKPSFWMGFGIYWVFFLGIHLTYLLKENCNLLHSELLWRSLTENCITEVNSKPLSTVCYGVYQSPTAAMALPVIPHICASFYSLASLPRCWCPTIYIPEHVKFD